MVAISLYRGNLHRVPDVPRRWLMPTRRISLKDFRLLLRRREKTISLATTTTTNANTSPPNPNPNPNSCPEQQQQQQQQGEVVGDNGCSKQREIPITQTLHSCQDQQDNTNDNSKEALPQVEDHHQQQQQQQEEEEEPTVNDAQDQPGSNDVPQIEQPKEIDETVSSPDTKPALPESDSGLQNGGGDGNLQAVQEEKLLVSAEPTVKFQESENVDVLSDKEKKKRELEEKLQVLNGRKHNLVQMLKQILNAEEEMKRRNSMQASVIRPPLPLQVDTTSDLGSSPRQTVTRVGSDANLCGDLEGESENVSPHNTHTRHFQHMRCTSPSASSPRRKTAHSSLQPNAVPHPARATHSGGVTASPSRFAPTGPQPQGHPANLPPPHVSVSGTQFMASSPSPAASGGTSVFRDSRLTSPS